MGICGSKSNTIQSYSQFRLARPQRQLKEHYDVIVVGSGYGGSIAACRSARAGKSVCVLERGKEWLPGDFPETELKSMKELQITSAGSSHSFGSSTGLYDFVVGHDVAVLQGCGLGGTSLINANVALDADPRVFEDEVWPQALRDDLENVQNVDRARFFDMVKPASYPEDFPALAKLDVMATAAEHMIRDIEDLEVEHVFSRPPLYVNFTDMGRNHVGVPQPACIGCGNCCSGCNTGAKNTLNLNYLQDAKNHGAEIFTQVLVNSISRDEDKGRWEISINLIKDKKTVTRGTISADIVIMGAGSLGSTNILMNSAKAGLKLSSQLGNRFSTNGDTVNFAFNGETDTNSRGKRPHHVDNTSDEKLGPGPCIAGLIDMRRSDRKLEEGYVLEEGTPPSSVDLVYKFLVNVANIDTGVDTTPNVNDWRELGRLLTGKAIDNTLAFLSMSQDDALGRLVLDEESGRVVVEYPDVGKEENFEIVLEGTRKAATGMKANFIPNPFWRGVIAAFRHARGIVTVHPLGGCGMGESGATGVVNHAGLVFVGDTEETHPGLLVVDGAIMPRSLGVNPTVTIGALAERCMRLLARDMNWSAGQS